MLIASALNEVCNGAEIEDFEFSTRLGADREEASSRYPDAMARLTIAELIKAVAEHPDAQKWEAEVEPAVALYITFAAGRNVESDTLEAADGSLIVIDRDADGQVCGIEIT